jgi:hypothetical protein
MEQLQRGAYPKKNLLLKMVMNLSQVQDFIFDVRTLGVTPVPGYSTCKAEVIIKADDLIIGNINA